MLRSRLKQLSKDSIIYGIGSIAAKSITLFLIPVYTRLFPPDEYGSIETLIIVNSFLAALIVIGMDSAQSFYFFEQKKYGALEQKRMISAIFQWRIFWGGIMVLFAVLLSPLLNAQLFGEQLKYEHFVISFLTALFIQIMNQNLEVYRLLYRSWVYIGLTLSYAIVSSAISITLIVFFKLGILGYFLGLLIGATFTALWGWWRIKSYLDFTKLHIQWWRKLLKFGLPLLPASFAMYFLNTTDRWFIIHYHGQQLMGIYSVAAKFAMLIYLAVYTFRRAWWPVALDTMQSKEGPELFRIMSRFYFAFAISFIVVLTALSPILIKWLAAPEYHDAYPFIGILAWSAVFYGMYIIVVIGIWKKEKTIWIPICMSIAAILNILLNYLLVPKYGGMGAALGTALSFFIWVVLVISISENLWRVGYPIKIFISQVTVGSISSGLILFLLTTQTTPWLIFIVTIISGIFLISTSVNLAQFNKIIGFVKARIYEKHTRN